MDFEMISFEESDNTWSVQVSYRIRSDILRADIITSELGVQPIASFDKGSTYTGKVIDPNTKKISNVTRVRPWGIWRISTKDLVQSLIVEDHVLYLLEILEPKAKTIRRYLDEKENKISFYVRREAKESHTSFEISSTLLTRMSVLCHYVEFMFI